MSVPTADGGLADPEERKFWEAQETEAQTRLGKRGGAFTTDHEARQFLAATGRAPRTILDVGGSKGLYTAACRALYPDARIVIVEPSTANEPLLQARFGADDKVTILRCAASRDPGRATLYANEIGSGLASLTRRDLRHLNIPFDAVEEVELRTIDTIAAAHFGDDPIDLIKLDVEGHELDCLAGGRQTLERTTAVQFEFGGCNIDTRTYVKDFFQLLTAAGFQLFRIAPIGLVLLRGYREHLESFMTSNYLALRR
jgi:FkbM family methyltransferase